MIPRCTGLSASKLLRESGELYPCVGFIVTNMSRPAENVVAFYNKRGTCEQWIKEGIMDTAVMSVVRRQRGSSSASSTRFQSRNFLRTLATPEPIKTGR